MTSFETMMINGRALDQQTLATIVAAVERELRRNGFDPADSYDVDFVLGDVLTERFGRGWQAENGSLIWRTINA